MTACQLCGKPIRILLPSTRCSAVTLMHGFRSWRNRPTGSDRGTDYLLWTVSLAPEYESGEPGSPVLAIKAVVEHTQNIPLPVKFLFIEKDPDRFRSLDTIIAEQRKRIDHSQRVSDVQAEQGECEAILSEGLDVYEGSGKPLGPAFFFLDQFGYSDVSLQLIGRIMGDPMCEILTYLNWGHMGRFLSDESKWNAISRAFGSEEWKRVLGLPHAQRAAFVLETYKAALRERGGARYVWHFAMCDKSGRLVYGLFFCTNSLRGLEMMKRAMLRVDETGSFCFSDRNDPEQGILFKECDDNSLAKDLHWRLAGRASTVAEVQEMVLTETPGVRHKGALRILEKTGRVEAVNPAAKRKPCTFPDENMIIRFADAVADAP